MNAENVGRVLDVLAQRFGSTGAALWAVIVRQVYVNAAVSAIVFCVCVWFCAWFWFRGRPRLHVWMNDGSYQDSRDVGMVCAYVVATLMLAGGIISFYAMTHALNPQFFALRYVLESVTH